MPPTRAGRKFARAAFKLDVKATSVTSAQAKCLKQSTSQMTSEGKEDSLRSSLTSLVKATQKESSTQSEKSTKFGLRPPRKTAAIPQTKTLKVGSLVWAKLQGWPWWPGMITKDPRFLLHHYGPLGSYHVQFFEEPSDFAWINETNIKPYQQDSDYRPPELAQLDLKYIQGWNMGRMVANAALRLSEEERVENLTVRKGDSIYGLLQVIEQTIVESSSLESTSEGIVTMEVASKETSVSGLNKPMLAGKRKQSFPIVATPAKMKHAEAESSGLIKHLFK